MDYIENCPNCGGELKSISIGWKCEKCGGLVDMKGGFHEPVNELFMPDDVLREQDEIAGEKYRRAIDRMGLFGKLFVEYSGDPRGPMGRVGGMSIVEEAQIMPVITDADGGTWSPVPEEVLQEPLKQINRWKEICFNAACEKQELSATAEKLERERDAAIAEIERHMFQEVIAGGEPCDRCSNAIYSPCEYCIPKWRSPERK